MDCIFCKIINGNIPCNKVYEDDLVIAFLDVSPKSNGHTLIVPKEHTLDITTIDSKILLHIFDIVKKIATDYEKKLNIKGYTLMQNNGKPQEVKHFHLHLIPVYDDTELLPVDEVYKKIV